MSVTNSTTVERLTSDITSAIAGISQARIEVHNFKLTEATFEDYGLLEAIIHVIVNDRFSDISVSKQIDKLIDDNLIKFNRTVNVIKEVCDTLRVSNSTIQADFVTAINNRLDSLPENLVLNKNCYEIPNATDYQDGYYQITPATINTVGVISFTIYVSLGQMTQSIEVLRRINKSNQ